ncbi:Mut7-C RNAse domain-containing protein, partial [Elusimicrobiota bacterium]
ISSKNSKNLVMQGLSENRIILTRNKHLGNKQGIKVYFIQDDNVDKQIKSLIEDAHISLSKSRLFTRCTVCNSEIAEVVDKNELKEKVPEYVFETNEHFHKCSKCGKIYWKGTHFDRILNDFKKFGIVVED